MMVPNIASAPRCPRPADPYARARARLWAALREAAGPDTSEAPTLVDCAEEAEFAAALAEARRLWRGREGGRKGRRGGR